MVVGSKVRCWTSITSLLVTLISSPLQDAQHLNMAKKVKEDPVPSINSVQNRDIIQRLNFMYQAGTFLQGLHNQNAIASSSSLEKTTNEPTSSRKRKSGKKAKTRRVEGLKTMGDLGRSYVHSMKVVGQRTTVKMCVISNSFHAN